MGVTVPLCNVFRSSRSKLWRFDADVSGYLNNYYRVILLHHFQLIIWLKSLRSPLISPEEGNTHIQHNKIIKWTRKVILLVKYESVICECECNEADLAVDAFLNSVSENQYIEGLIQHPHHHGLRVQRTTVLWSTHQKKTLYYTDSRF